MANKKKVEEKKPIVKTKEKKPVVEKKVVVELPVISGKKVIKVLKETDTEILYFLEDGTTTYVQK